MAWAWRAALVSFVAALVFPSRAFADERAIGVVVRTSGAIDEALFERTAGQLSDLPTVLHRASELALEPTLPARLERARELATREGARVVVWFEHPSSSETVVFVDVPGSARVLVRHVTGGASTSAMLEASSLVVRTAVVALEAGETLGVPDEELTREQPAPPAPPTPPPPRPRAPMRWPAEVRVAPARPRWSAFGAMGWQLALDGRSPAGARTVTAEGGARYGPWSAGLRGAFGLPSRSHDDLVSLEIWRHSGTLLVARSLSPRAGWEATLAAGPALILYRRSVTARRAGFVATPPNDTTTFAGSFEARVSWRRSRVVLGLALGADAVARPPVFSYEAGGVEHRLESWFVQPRVGFFVSTP